MVRWSSGIPDDWEVQHGLDPLNNLDATEDPDRDGVINLDEYRWDTDPQDPASSPVNRTIHLLRGFNVINYTGRVNPVLTAFEFIRMVGDQSEIESIYQLDRAIQTLKFVKYNASGEPEGEDFEIVNGEGLIIYSKVEKDVDLYFTKDCPGIDLLEGVNIVGIFCASPDMTAFQLLINLGSANVSSIQRFNPTTGEFETAGYGLSGQCVGVDFPIEAGEGYFVFMKQEKLGFKP